MKGEDMKKVEGDRPSRALKTGDTMLLPVTVQRLAVRKGYMRVTYETWDKNEATAFVNKEDLVEPPKGEE